MAKIIFTDNLRRHIDCPTQYVNGRNLSEVLNNLFANNPQLKNYVLDDQNRLRKHMLISVDGEMIQDRLKLSSRVGENSEIYIMQALSGG